MKVPISKIVQCYDNGGKTADRYTAVFVYKESGMLYPALGMSCDPSHPQGFGYNAEVAYNDGFGHLGKRVTPRNLPDAVKRQIQASIRINTSFHWDINSLYARDSVNVKLLDYDDFTLPLINPWAESSFMTLYKCGPGDCDRFAIWVYRDSAIADDIDTNMEVIIGQWEYV